MTYKNPTIEEIGQVIADISHERASDFEVLMKLIGHYLELRSEKLYCACGKTQDACSGLCDDCTCEQLSLFYA